MKRVAPLCVVQSLTAHMIETDIRGRPSAGRRQPVSLCACWRPLARRRPCFSDGEPLAALDAVSIGDVRAFQSGLLAESELEALVCGNVDEAGATSLLRSVQAALPSAPLPRERRPERRVRRVPLAGATQQFAVANAAEPNSAFEMHLQVGSDEADNWLHLLLLSQMIDKAMYAELRTRQQLGYIVQAGVGELDGVRALSLVVQSSVFTPPALEERVEAFLRLFRGTLSLVSDAELATYRDSLVVALADVDQRLDSQSARLWRECATRRYDFGRPWRSAGRMRRIGKEGLLQFYDEYVAAGGAKRRRLSTHVFAQSAAPRKLRVDTLDGQDDYFPALPDRLPPPFGEPQI